jgi:NADH-quinone oxidoreductase subunit A
MPTDSYLPLTIFIFLGLVVVALFYLPAVWLGPSTPSQEKLEPFECGNPPLGEPTVPFNPLFYQVAILFLVFDVEIAFLYPFAVIFSELGRSAIFAMAGFVTVLIVALVYVVRKGVLRWV